MPKSLKTKPILLSTPVACAVMLFANATGSTTLYDLSGLIADAKNLQDLIDGGTLGPTGNQQISNWEVLTENMIATAIVATNCAALAAVEPTLQPGVYSLYPTSDIKSPVPTICPKYVVAGSPIAGGFTLMAGHCQTVGSLNLCMKQAGNLSLADSTGSIVWNTSDLPFYNANGYAGTTADLDTCTSCVAIFSSDGNLNLSNPGFGSSVYWSTGMAAQAGATLQLSSGKPFLAIINASNVPVWAQ